MTPNKYLRKRILEKGYEMGHGLFGSALSCLDCVKYLYDNILREGDLFIMSKGHAAMALFSVLESKGKKPKWTIHLGHNEEEGIYATTGSLGHGLPIALGRALARKIKGEGGNVYVLVGDGEMEEGSNWEALILADRLNLENLTILVDRNKYQSMGSVKEIANFCLDNLTAKIRAFGCNVTSINGHDLENLAKLKNLDKGLNAVILDTIKGKGVKYLEETHMHVLNFNNIIEKYYAALEDLK